MKRHAGKTYLRLNFNASDYDTLLQKSSMANMSMSEYIRYLINDISMTSYEIGIHDLDKNGCLKDLRNVTFKQQARKALMNKNQYVSAKEYEIMKNIYITMLSTEENMNTVLNDERDSEIKRVSNELNNLLENTDKNVKRDMSVFSVNKNILKSNDFEVLVTGQEYENLIRKMLDAGYGTVPITDEKRMSEDDIYLQKIEAIKGNISNYFCDMIRRKYFINLSIKRDDISKISEYTYQGIHACPEFIKMLYLQGFEFKPMATELQDIYEKIRSYQIDNFNIIVNDRIQFYQKYKKKITISDREKSCNERRRTF